MFWSWFYTKPLSFFSKTAPLSAIHTCKNQEPLWNARAVFCPTSPPWSTALLIFAKATSVSLHPKLIPIKGAAILWLHRNSCLSAQTVAGSCSNNNKLKIKTLSRIIRALPAPQHYHPSSCTKELFPDTGTKAALSPKSHKTINSIIKSNLIFFFLIATYWENRRGTDSANYFLQPCCPSIKQDPSSKAKQDTDNSVKDTRICLLPDTPVKREKRAKLERWAPYLLEKRQFMFKAQKKNYLRSLQNHPCLAPRLGICFKAPG